MSDQAAVRRRPKGQPVEMRIVRLRQQIRNERDVTHATILTLTPRLDAAARIVWRLKSVPALASRFATVLLPLASVVFRRSPVLRSVVRLWGLAKLAKTVASRVSSARPRATVELTGEIH